MAVSAGSSRPFLLLLVMLLCSSGLVARLAFWQVMQHGRLALAAAREHALLSVQQPSRGEILDARGNPLATEIAMNQVYAIPKEMRDPARTAAIISPLVGVSVMRLQRWFDSLSGYILLAPRIDESTSRRIRRLALPGIVLNPVPQRDYPGGAEASQVLGFVGGNNRGDAGLESYYDRLLAGHAGLRSVLKDTAGNDIHISPDSGAPVHDGATLRLSLDGVVQGFVEDELAKAVKKHSADGGTIIVMDPRTGYILGMASTPAYNPNHYGRYPAARFVNPSVENVYEPGSTFKIITMAAGLDTHTITPTTAFEDTGQFFVADHRVLHNWNDGGFGWETMTQVLQHSANVGAAWVSQRLGRDAFYRYVKAFGFGKPTGIDLPNDSAGLLPLPGDTTWTSVNQFTNAFGQGLAVTPLQLVRAAGAVANHGVLMQPQVVQQIRYDGHIIDHPPVTAGRVMSRQSARTLTDMLVRSAVGGEASLGLVQGYNIAAKTGTSNVAGPDGKYITGDTIASIVGYAPAYRPRFIILVKIDHPRDTPWGSIAAAPVLHNLFQDLFMYDHIPPAQSAAGR
ncbi:MAG: peptidoglycan D,D-transpeptidase FtsI family protein [Chloroflexota bacterium]